MEWMVDEPIILVHADGRRTPSAIQIGIPWQLGGAYEAGNYESRCWARVDGLIYLPGAMIGGSTLDALTTALQVIAHFIRKFLEDGGRILHKDGSEAALDLIFGPLMSGEGEGL